HKILDNICDCLTEPNRKSEENMSSSPLDYLREPLAPAPYLLVHFVIDLTISILSLFAFSALAHDITVANALAQFDQSLANLLHAQDTTTSDNFFLFLSL